MSTIDYIMVRRDEIRTIKDCKVIPAECVATQHRLVVLDMNVVMTRKQRPRIKQQNMPTRYSAELSSTRLNNRYHVDITRTTSHAGMMNVNNYTKNISTQRTQSMRPLQHHY